MAWSVAAKGGTGRQTDRHRHTEDQPTDRHDRLITIIEDGVFGGWVDKMEILLLRFTKTHRQQQKQRYV